LDALRHSLDAQATGIAGRQDISLEGRKKLADATKSQYSPPSIRALTLSATEYRKLSEANKLKSFGALLKAYQDEIDRLTRRSSEAEKIFLQLYQSLSEIPDPSPGLHAAAVRSETTLNSARAGI